MKGILYLPVLCRYRKQVQLDTLSLDVGVYLRYIVWASSVELQLIGNVQSDSLPSSE